MIVTQTFVYSLGSEEYFAVGFETGEVILKHAH